MAAKTAITKSETAIYSRNHSLKLQNLIFKILCLLSNINIFLTTVSLAINSKKFDI